VPQQLDQILKRVHLIQLAGVNQAHEDVAYLGSMQRPIKLKSPRRLLRS
jgi:hypothetical protein